MKKISSKPKQVFVTGGTGKIGSRLVPKLLNKGYRVIALVRDKSRFTLKHNNLEAIEADILEVNKYQKQLHECDYVYHLAVYQNIADRDINNFLRVNVEGARLLLDALKKSKVKKLIYLSTIMVFKPSKKRIDEESPKKTSGKGNYYVETKLAALELIEKYKTKVPIITLYPTVVVDPDEIRGETAGPASKWQSLLWKIIGGGVPGGLMGMVGNKKRMTNYILMDNLITAMINVMDKGKVGKDYILGWENLTVGNYLRAVLKMKGRVFFPLRIPLCLLKIISLINLPRLEMINFIAKNPPEDINVNSQKAVDDLGLEIAKLEDCYS